MEIKTSARNLDKAVENVVKLIMCKQLTISTAESCTGGLLSQLITSVSGSSACFELGLCTYANRMKEKLLGVPSALLEEFGAVSGQVALSMARGLKEVSNADICVSVTGIAGPLGGSEEKPVGTVFMGYVFGESAGSLAVPKESFADLNREEIRWGTAAFVLDKIYEHLSSL